MKTLVRFSSLLVMAAGLVLAADSSASKQVTVDVSKLSESARAEIEKAQKQDTIKDNVSWAVGIGHELGTAVNESLSAVSNEAQKLADSRLGHFIMFIVAFKVIGAPIIHVVVGFIMLLTGLSLVTWSYRNTCMERSIILKKEVGQGFWMFRSVTTTYDRYKHNDYTSDVDTRRFVHGIGALIVVAISATVMFAGW